jgi:parvulin-like peptidyl-prolyl isomerase
LRLQNGTNDNLFKATGIRPLGGERKIVEGDSVKRTKRNGRTSAAKHNSAARNNVWLVITAIVLLLIVMVGIIIITALRSARPVSVTYQEALIGLRAENVSEVIAPDLAADFSSGNYSLRELEQKYPGFSKEIRAVNARLKEAGEEVVASVNSEVITRSELNAQISLLPQQYRLLMDDSQVLQQMVDEKLLLQEARRLSITPSDSQIDAAYAELLVNGNMTKEQLQQNLETFGLGEKELRAMLSKQLVLNELFNKTIDQNTTVTEAEALAFYAENNESFLVPASVTVRHILIAVDNTTDDAAAKKLAEEALARYQKGEDFCTLVTQYTKDLGSKNMCGEYTFGKGFMVPEFEAASFSLKPGETGIVKSQFGYHVVLKVNETPESVVPFGEVKDQIESQISGEKRMSLYQAYIDALRANANITNKLVPEPQISEQPSVISPSETLVEVSNETQPGETPQKVPAQVEKPVTSTVTITAKNDTVLSLPAEDLTGLASCLSGKGVVLYTASWATASEKEKAKFGTAALKLTVVECTDSCEGVDAFPTWKVGGKLYARTLSFSELRSLSGCE